MKREIITIDERSRLIVPIDSDKIWMSETELAELFGVIGPTIRAAIKAVYKSGVLKERETKRYIRLMNGNRIDVYNMEVGLSCVPAQYTWGVGTAQMADPTSYRPGTGDGSDYHSV